MSGDFGNGGQNFLGSDHTLDLRWVEQAAAHDFRLVSTGSGVRETIAVEGGYEDATLDLDHDGTSIFDPDVGDLDTDYAVTGTISSDRVDLNIISYANQSDRVGQFAQNRVQATTRWTVGGQTYELIDARYDLRFDSGRPNEVDQWLYQGSIRSGDTTVGRLELRAGARRPVTRGVLHRCGARVPTCWLVMIGDLSAVDANSLWTTIPAWRTLVLSWT